MKIKTPLSKSAKLYYISAGVIGTLGFAPFSIWLFALLSPALLFAGLLRCKTLKRALTISLLWGFGFWLTGVHWLYVSIATYSPTPPLMACFMVVIAALILSFFVVLTSISFILLKRYLPLVSWPLLFATLWVVVDALKANAPIAFPWLELGYAHHQGLFHGLLPILGVQGATFFNVLFAAVLCLCFLFRKLTSLRWQMVALFLIAIITLGLNWTKSIENDRTTFTLVQPNVDQHIKWRNEYRSSILNQLFSNSLTYSRNTDWLIWPEAALPALEEEIPELLVELDQWAKSENFTLVTGILQEKYNSGLFNTILAIGAEQPDYHITDPQSRYYKHHLVPFGEYFPLPDAFLKWLPNLGLRFTEFNTGPAQQNPIRQGNKSLLSSICYEVLFSHHLWRNFQPDTYALLTVSNDTWFGRSIGPAQHLQIAQTRSAELGRPLIRATNNGFTVITDDHGFIQAELPRFGEHVLHYEVPNTQGNTPFSQWGPYAFWCLICVLILLLLHIALMYPKHSKR